MIYGTGVDIVQISRIEKTIGKHAGRFEERIFTSREIEYCRSKANPSVHFAARFAVKEAALKSLGTGMAGGIHWKDMEIVNSDETGQPVLNLSGEGQKIFHSLKLKKIHVSISHEKNYAIGHAIAEL